MIIKKKKKKEIFPSMFNKYLFGQLTSAKELGY